MPDRNLVELIAAMDVLSSNLKARLPEIPLLEPLQTDLDAWLAETRGLENQQEIYTARLRETNEKRRRAEAHGIELRAQADAALRGQFGTKNKVLHEFGLKPRGGRRTAKKAETPPPAPTPAKAASS
ncbi:MAG TPA: hypothetical protein VNJ70_03115 [Thermoanaerobaculia bacterium]|nr:hypothetical protein [Thermoanaerobaculia bacterium]